MQALCGREILTDSTALVCRLSRDATPGEGQEAEARQLCDQKLRGRSLLPREMR
jgi:hypothetical protein